MNTGIHRRRVPDSFVLMLYEYLSAAGADAETVLQYRCPTESTSALGDLAIDVWSSLLHRAADHLDDPQLGLHLGQTVAPRHIGVLGYVVMASRTLGEALSHLHRYQRLIYDVTPMIMRQSSNYLDLVWDAEHGRPGPLVDESAITALVQLCRNLCGEKAAPLEVHFINAQPADLDAYRNYFACPVMFEQPETIIRISWSTLQLPLLTADPAMLHLMQQHADSLLAALPEVSPLVDQVRRLIGRALHEHEPDIERVAKSMELSPRTLQRRLLEAGTTFRDEVAAVRREMSERYLRETRLGMLDIALMLGYSEHSAFTRSFIRWTGQTPQQYRKGNRQSSR